jgi:heme exporter protein B
MNKPYTALMVRNIRLLSRNPGNLLQPLLFFVVVASLFPMAVSPDPQFLQGIAPGVIWVAALLSTLLALDSFLKSDFDDGTLELISMSRASLPLMSLSMVGAHWILTGLPLIMVSALLALMLNLPIHALPALLISLLVGTPTLSLLGCIGAALTVGLRRSGILLTLIVVPFYIPVLIFGTSAVNASVLNLPWIAHIYLLGSILILSLTLAPFAISSAIRVSLN